MPRGNRGVWEFGRNLRFRDEWVVAMQCSDPNWQLSPFEEGLRLYAEGEYWHSHEAWENFWRSATGAERELCRALIQLDAALIHVQQEHWAGVQRLLRRVARRLDSCPDSLLGLDLENLREQIAAIQAETAALQRGDKKHFDWSIKPTLEIHRNKTDNLDTLNLLTEV